jgi:DNA-damage-inducible protein D
MKGDILQTNPSVPEGRGRNIETKEFAHNPPAIEGGTPFDQIREIGSEGSEFWSARELQQLVEYGEWRNFEAAVLKARASITQDQGEIAAQHHIGDSNKMIQVGKGAARQVDDYRLTRHGAYRVLQECDGRKPRIAEAKAYFAHRAQEAELMDDMDWDLRLIVEGAKALQETRRELRQVQIAQQRQGDRQDVLEARVDGLEGHTGWMTALAYARRQGLPSHLAYCRKLGKQASELCRAHGIEPVKTSDQRFGDVNCYPEEILDEAAKALTRVAA